MIASIFESIWFIESLAFIALLCNMLGYRQTTMRGYRMLSCIAMVFLSTHFFLLGAYAATIGCGSAFIRNIISLYKTGWSVTIPFIILYLILMCWQFIALGDGPVILLAYAGSIAFTIGTLQFEETNTRMKQVFLTAETLSVVYAILVGSILGTVFNLFNISILCWGLYEKRRIKPTRY